MRGPGQSRILITGASGLLGRLLLERCAGRYGCVYALRHLGTVSPGRAGIATIAGDVTAPLLGLSTRDYDELCGELTGIIHCAASTDFNRPLSESRLVNVEGTRNVLRLARKCPHLERVGVLSTAYVAGKRTGLIGEDELIHRCGFVNSYERSKYEMERLLRAAMRTIPLAAYRLSTVIGDSATGRVEQFNAFHQAVRLFSRGLLPMIPGDAETPVDLIASDFAADAVLRLFEDAFEAGGTYHVVAGEGSSIRLGDLLSEAERIFRRPGGEWLRYAITAPPIVDLETFELLDETTSRTDNPFLGGIVASMRSFAPQLCYAKSFDATRARGGLEGTGIGPIEAGELFERVTRYCLRTHWSARGR